MAKGHQLINQYDALLEKESDAAKRMALRQEANQAIADMLKKRRLQPWIKCFMSSATR